MDEVPSARERLLGADDVAPVGIERAEGASSFVLICDHAGNHLPAKLRSLGLDATQILDHIAWDIGVLEVSRHICAQLDCALIYQRYSRLVIDCNRPPRSAMAIPVLSDGTSILGNVDLSDRERSKRVDEVFTPYHAAIDGLLERRARAGRETVLISMHSFTPRLSTGVDTRPWHVAVLFNRSREFPLALAAALAAEGDLNVGVNEPYRVDDASDYGIPVHGEGRGLPHALLEIRQDLIATSQQAVAWGNRLARVLRELERTRAMAEQ